MGSPSKFHEDPGNLLYGELVRFGHRLPWSPEVAAARGPARPRLGVSGTEQPTRDEPGLGRVLKHAEQSLLRAKSAAVKPSGVTLAQYVALAELDAQPGITGASLARACLVTPQAMVVVLKAMHEQGLIQRITHPRHPHVLEIHLTDVGREVLANARQLAEPVEQRIRDSFSQQEQSTLCGLLTRLIDVTAQSKS